MARPMDTGRKVMSSGANNTSPGYSFNDIAAAFTKTDFTSSRGCIFFACGQGSTLQKEPAQLHLEAWNKRVRLPPGVVARYFAHCLKEVGQPAIKTVPRIIFSVAAKNRN